MTSHLRTITHGFLEWRGLLVHFTFERQRFVDHIQIETAERARAPLPITQTGYLSSFVSTGLIEDAGGPDRYVETLLDRAASGKAWIEIEPTIRQYALL